MTTEKGEWSQTLKVSAGDYAVEWDCTPDVNVINHTEGLLQVATESDFSDYFELEKGEGYNEFWVRSRHLYLRAEAAGTVSIVRCRDGR